VQVGLQLLDLAAWTVGEHADRAHIDHDLAGWVDDVGNLDPTPGEADVNAVTGRSDSGLRAELMDGRLGHCQYPCHFDGRRAISVTYDLGRSRAGSGCLRERMFWKVGEAKADGFPARSLRPSLPADQRGGASRPDTGPPPSAMCPCLPGPEGAESTDGHGRQGVGGYADRPARFPASDAMKEQASTPGG
jgi:hypothetical protein